MTLLVALAAAQTGAEAGRENDQPPVRCYYGPETSGLYYAEFVNGAWKSDLVDASAGCGSSDHVPALARDVEGEPSIAYYDVAAGGLKYANRIGNAWTTNKMVMLR